jgi:hypothetical protein
VSRILVGEDENKKQAQNAGEKEKTDEKELIKEM